MFGGPTVEAEGDLDVRFVRFTLLLRRSLGQLGVGVTVSHSCWRVCLRSERIWGTGIC